MITALQARMTTRECDRYLLDIQPEKQDICKVLCAVHDTNTET